MVINTELGEIEYCDQKFKNATIQEGKVPTSLALCTKIE